MIDASPVQRVDWIKSLPQLNADSRWTDIPSKAMPPTKRINFSSESRFPKYWLISNVLFANNPHCNNESPVRGDFEILWPNFCRALSVMNFHRILQRRWLALCSQAPWFAVVDVQVWGWASRRDLKQDARLRV